MRRLGLGAVRAIGLGILVAQAFALERVIGDIVGLVVGVFAHAQPCDSDAVQRVHVIVGGGHAGVLRGGWRRLRASTSGGGMMRTPRSIHMADASGDGHVGAWLAQIDVPGDFGDLALGVE